MRTLETAELNDVSGGTLRLLSLFSCFSKPVYCAPAPAPAPAPCAPAPKANDCAPKPRRRGC